MLQLKFGDYVRVNKKKARNLFNSGVPLLILPNKANPTSPWFEGCNFHKSEQNTDFDKFINEYSYYNCNNELGYYCNYYVDKFYLED